MGVIQIANQRVEMMPKQTWLGIIHFANTHRRKLMPNGFFNAALLEADEHGKLMPIPKEIGDRTLWTGTFAMVGDHGKPFGRFVESECYFNEIRKHVIVELDPEHAAIINSILWCNHGFMPDGTPLLPLLTEKGKPVHGDEDMLGTGRLFLQLNGEIHKLQLQMRMGGSFEKVGLEHTRGWFPDSAAMGLLMRGGAYGQLKRCRVGLNSLQSARLRAFMEADHFPCH